MEKHKHILGKDFGSWGGMFGVNSEEKEVLPCLIYHQCECGFGTLGFEAPPFPSPLVEDLYKKMKAFYEPLLEAALERKKFEGARFYCGNCNQLYGCKGHNKKVKND